jgi:hypothetical protein
VIAVRLVMQQHNDITALDHLLLRRLTALCHKRLSTEGNDMT